MNGYRCLVQPKVGTTYSTIDEARGDSPARELVHLCVGLRTAIKKKMSTPRGARIHYGVYGSGRLRDPAMCTGWAWAVALRDKPI